MAISIFLNGLTYLAERHFKVVVPKVMLQSFLKNGSSFWFSILQIKLLSSSKIISAITPWHRIKWRARRISRCVSVSRLRRVTIIGIVLLPLWG
jgi:hypothetical protein